MDDIENIIKKVIARAGELKDRTDRMDKDFARWNIRPQGRKTRISSTGTSFVEAVTKRGSEIEITANSPRTFCDDVQAQLTGSERQISIHMLEEEGEDVRDECGKLERLLEFGFEKADDRLVAVLQPPLFDSLVWFSIVRGWIGGRFNVYKQGKGSEQNVVFDYLPYDPRWLTYGLGANGLLWTDYVTTDTAEALEDQWGKSVQNKVPWYKPWSKPKNSYEIHDHWHFEKPGKVSNGVYCGDMWLKEPKTYQMDRIPVLISPVPTRPPVRSGDADHEEGYGESILAPNREIDDLINEIGSMWASHANLLYKQPVINYYGPQGVELDKTVFFSDAVLNLPEGQNKLDTTPVKEISPTMVNLFTWLDRMRIKGSKPDIDIGSPPPSGTLYNLIQETSNRILNPQLRNLNRFYTNICQLVESQLVSGNIPVDVRTELDKKLYQAKVKPVDIKRTHIIKVEFTARTPWSQLDTYQVADMAKRLGLPDGFIHEHILRLPDPKSLSDMAAIEMAEHSPKLAMLRAIVALIKRGRQEEAEQLIRDMYMTEVMDEKMAMEGQGETGMGSAPPINTGEAGSPV